MSWTTPLTSDRGSYYDDTDAQTTATSDTHEEITVQPPVGDTFEIWKDTIGELYLTLNLPLHVVISEMKKVHSVHGT